MKNSATDGCQAYGERRGCLQRSLLKFSCGGSFPELHFAQYPPGLAVQASLTLANPCRMGAPGRFGENDSVLMTSSGEEGSTNAGAHHSDLLPVSTDVSVSKRPSSDDTEIILARTKSALFGRVEQRTCISMPSTQPEYIKYTPATIRASSDSGISDRLIRLHEVQSDPLEPPRFRHKKVPRGGGSPPAAVMHSPPRSSTAKQQADWKIPPSISNWKNPKGYTIPLDKRLAADGRGLQDVHINDNFAKLSEALYLAEHKAREAVETRAKIQHELLNEQKKKKEFELRELAELARLDRADRPEAQSDYRILERQPSTQTTVTGAEEQRTRDQTREDRRRERERERRSEGILDVSKKSKITRDRERDIGEQLALKKSRTAPNRSTEGSYDQRLFDQDIGICSGFAVDDAYDLYDEPLFHEKGGEKCGGRAN